MQSRGIVPRQHRLLYGTLGVHGTLGVLRASDDACEASCRANTVRTRCTRAIAGALGVLRPRRLTLAPWYSRHSRRVITCTLGVLSQAL